MKTSQYGWSEFIRGIMLVLILSILSSSPKASEDVWVPELNFSVENGSYTETLYFISGVGHSLNLVNELHILEGKSNIYCPPKNKTIGSKYIVEILNRLSVKDISAVLAVSVVISDLRRQFPCE